MSGVSSSDYRWIAFSTLVKKRNTSFFRIWVQTLVPPVITITLYFVIFGKLDRSQYRSDGWLFLYGLYRAWSDFNGCYQ